MMPDGKIVERLRAARCVFAEDEARLIRGAACGAAELSAMVDRRLAGLPLEQVVGWAAFRGLRIVVEPGVFVPRRRTEFLVRQAVAGGAVAAGDVVVDLCCGSGAGGTSRTESGGGGRDRRRRTGRPTARRRHRPGRRTVRPAQCDGCRAARVRGRSVRAAAAPAARHGGRAGRERSLCASREVGLLPAEARDHEPLVALDGGADGLDVLRRVAAGAREWPAPGGRLLVETTECQAARAAAVFAGHGLTARTAADEDGTATVVIGTR